MPTVKVFSTEACPWCHKAKEFLQQNKITFTDYNVAEDEEARNEMIEKSGQLGVPVILVDDTVVVGFNKLKLSQLLGIR
ncbi:glutathione S-transferase N-terminal domain-containing protein [Candidatus Woesearchaeota archaeon]|nr:glutathione S-transferase N-terminal domain-containing protein [Candidatus Woesearchaeota archaeon]